MKTRSLIVALGLAALSGVAAAESGIKTNQADDVAHVYGRSGIPPLHANATVVTRTAQEVVPGPTTEEGPVAVAIGSGGLEVDHGYGRS